MTRKPAQSDLPTAAEVAPLPASGGCYTLEAGLLVQAAPEGPVVEPSLNPAETEA